MEQKALLFFLIQICLTVNSVGAVKCYYCAWINSTDGVELESLKDGISDVCQAQNFRPGVITTVDCKVGCLTSVFHEGHFCNSTSKKVFQGYIYPKNRKEQQEFIEGFYKNVTFKPTTILVRQCPSNLETYVISGCEIVRFESGCEQRLCFCKSNLCNGPFRSQASAFFNMSSLSSFITSRVSLAWTINMVYVMLFQ